MEYEGSGAMVVRDALRGVFRQRRVAISVYLGIVATAVGAIFVLPPQYRAVSEVLVTSNSARVSTSPEKPTEFVRATQVGDAELNSQLEILHSRYLVAGVLQDLGVDDKEPEANVVVRVLRMVLGAPIKVVRLAYQRVHGLGNEPGSPLYWKVRDVLASLEVSIAQSSNVVVIAFEGPDPVWSRTFVERLTAAYLERQAEMQSEADAEGFFAKQSQMLQQKLADSETALRALREKAGTLTGQQTEIHDRLNEFNADLARAKVARVEQEQRVAYLQRAFGAQHRDGGLATPELLALEAKRAELAARYQPGSERVRDVNEMIARLRAAIGSYDGVTGVKDVAVDLTGAQASLSALKGKEQGLVQQRDEYLKKAELLDAQSFDLVRLERQVKLDEEAYVSYERAAEQSRLSSAMEQSKMLRLSIVEPASVLLDPVSPKKGLILLLAGLGGLAVSVAAAFVWDHLDGTVKTADDVRRLAKVEVLACFPELT